MKRIMIVDDEFLVRIGIKSMIDWEAHGYSIVSEAVNGQDAIEKIKQFQPQIILTDLVMEPINGLQLIEHCATCLPDIRFIVLSNYNDFEKVKTAMKLGARDFLFKLTVSPDELLSILDGVSREIAENRFTHKDAEKLLTRNAGVIRQRLIHLIEEHSYAKASDVIEELSLIEAKCDFLKPYVILYLNVTNYLIYQSAGNLMEPDLFASSLENIIGEVMSELYVAQTFWYGDGTCIVIINLPSKTVFQEFLACLNASYTCIVQYISQYFGMQIMGVLSRSTIGIKDFAGSTAECRRALDARFFLRESKLLSCDHEQPFRIILPLPTECSPTRWQTFLAHFNLEPAEEFLKMTFDYLFSMNQTEPRLLREHLQELYRILKADGLSKGIVVDKLMDSSGLLLYDAILKYDQLMNIKNSFTMIFDQYAALNRKNGGKTLKREIARILAYVSDNLAGDLSVTAAASLVHMSESYFSHLFKNEMGVNFIDYVNRSKIEKAKELLIKTDLKINEIASQVGVDNPNYFSILFKKIEKCSPYDYRNREIAE